VPRHPRPSATTEGLSDSVFSALAAKARTHPGPVYPLHVGDTWLEPHPTARVDGLFTGDHPGLHRYAPVRGEPVLLDAIAARHGGRVDRDAVQVMAGATAGLSVVCQTLLDPGDEVLLPAPYWPLIRGIIASRGAAAVEVPFFDRLDGEGFDPEAALEAAVTARTAAVYLNTPHNPTGRVLPADVLDAIVRVAERHDLWIVCDEAYEALAFVDEVPPPVWTRPEVAKRCVVTHTLSKSHGIAGARIGYTHGPEGIMAAVRSVQAFQTYCAARPMQIVAARALSEAEGWVGEARALYVEAGRKTAKAFGVPPPEGGTFLFVDMRPWLKPGEALLGFLSRCLDAGVLLTPGHASGKDYGTFARICFTSVPPGDLDLALDRLRGVLDDVGGERAG
jgi:N-succinyldiaminopimelate aminotransferase